MTLPTETAGDASSSSPAPRATVACVACRVSKIRCLRLEQSDNLACENCQNQGKECHYVPLAKTRRRKRTDKRVSELELQVRELTAAMRQNKDTPSTAPELDAALYDRGIDLAFPTDELHGRGMVEAPHVSAQTSSMGLGSSETNSLSVPFTESGHESSNVVISLSASLQLFRHYQTCLAHIYPIVPIPEETTKSEVDLVIFRRDHPMLFLTMTTAAAAAASEQTRDALHEKTVRYIAKVVMVDGEKSLEILQALLITVAWYRPCGSFNDTKFLQFTQAASLMAQELGLDLAAAESRPFLGDDSSEMIRLRTFLASYCQSSSKALLSSTRTPQFDPASVALCLASFESASAASGHDRDLFEYAKCQFLVQEALEKLQDRHRCLEDIDIEDNHVRSTLSVYTSQLERLLLDRIGQHSFLKVAVHGAIIRLHEIALYRDYHVTDLRPPFLFNKGPRRIPSSIGPEYLTAIQRCKSSAHALLDTICMTDSITLSAMPSVVFVRMMHCLAILYHIHVLATSRSHPLSAVFDVNELCLPESLERMIQLLRGMEYQQSFHGANKYLAFLINLRSRCGEDRPPYAVDGNGHWNVEFLDRLSAQGFDHSGTLSADDPSHLFPDLVDSPDWWNVNTSLDMLSS